MLFGPLENPGRTFIEPFSDNPHVTLIIERLIQDLHGTLVTDS